MKHSDETFTDVDAPTAKLQEAEVRRFEKHRAEFLRKRDAMIDSARKAAAIVGVSIEVATNEDEQEPETIFEASVEFTLERLMPPREDVDYYEKCRLAQLCVSIFPDTGNVIPDGWSGDAQEDFCAVAPWKAAVLEEMIAAGGFIDPIDLDEARFAANRFRGEE